MNNDQMMYWIDMHNNNCGPNIAHDSVILCLADYVYAVYAIQSSAQFTGPNRSGRPTSVPRSISSKSPLPNNKKMPEKDPL